MELVYIAGLILMGWVIIDAALGFFSSMRSAQARAKSQDRKAEQLKADLADKSSGSSPEVVTRWRGFRRFSVIDKVTEAEDISSFYLSPVDGGVICPFEPGQHIGFRFTVPGDSKPTIRSYSLSAGASDGKTFRITVKKVPAPPGSDFPPGKGSKYFHEEIDTGSIIEVSAPNGKFTLDRRDERPAVFIAGGIGITPLMSMLETMSSENIQRTCHLFHAVRSHRDHAFSERLKQLNLSLDHLHLHTYFSDPEEGEELPEKVRTGFLSVDEIRNAVGHLDVQIYICGPPPMMQALVPSLEDAGVPSRDLKMEAFGPASVKKKKSPSTESNEESAQDVCKIKFKPSNKEVIWDGESSILEMAEDHDIDIDSSCRAGSCGTCQVRLISGDVRYEYDPACEPDEGHCLTCIGVPEGNIEIES